MTRKTLAAAIAVAVLSSSAMFASTSQSQAGYYGGYGYGYGGYGHGYGYYNHYEPHCFWKKRKFFDPYYGYFWKKIQICR